MGSHLNSGRANAVYIRQGLGEDAGVAPKVGRKNKRRTRATQEQHKRNTRERLPIPWLVPGLKVAFGSLLGRNYPASNWFTLCISLVYLLY
jgi:hypothetical protein